MCYRRILETAVVMSALAFVACSKEAVPEERIKGSEIYLVVENAAITKAGGVQDINGLKASGFTMDIVADEAYNNGKTKAGKYGDTRTVKWENDAWVISSDAFWINDTQMSFWAYNNMASDECSFDTPSAAATELEFTYPKSGRKADGQTDLLFAKTSATHDGSDDHTSGTSGDQIALSFRHALSQISFIKGGTFELPSGYDIGRIEISGLKDSGSAAFDGTDFVWNSLTGSAHFETDGSTPSFLVIPQNAKAAFLQVTLSKDSSDDIVLTAPMKDYDMQAGKNYVYSISVINGGKELSLELSVSDWNYLYRGLELNDPSIGLLLNKDTYSGGVLESASSRIFIHNGMPVSGSFKLNSPKGAKLLLALDGNLDAFEVSPKICYIGNAPIDFTITPKVHDPKIDYQTRLHIYLVGPDGSVSELDKDVMKEGSPAQYKHYTIILPAQ